jgi:TPR repeat protein
LSQIFKNNFRQKFLPSKTFFITGVRVRKLSFFFVLGIILISPLITYASDYGDGMNAMKHGNHDEAVKFFRIAAEIGDARAQHCLGVILNKGQGVKKNYEESFKWLNLAAKQGFSQAKLDLEILIYHKLGEVHYNEAISLDKLGKHGEATKHFKIAQE